jgi:alpha-galactosidase
MQALANRILSTGRRAGLWLAPLIAVRSSRLFRSHPGWFLRDDRGRLVSAGHNWGEPLYALDTTQPEVRAWLEALMKQVRSWGFDYLKLDFLYAGALPGKRFVEKPREAAYRETLQLLRSSMGEDAFFLTCGTPILPALGLCDAMRIGPDVAGEWEVRRDARLFNNPTSPSVRNAIRTTLHRLWLKPLVLTDPDVAYFSRRGVRLSPAELTALQDLAHISGFRATSDLPDSLTAEERAALLAFLSASPQIEQTGRYRFTIDGREADYADAVRLPPAPEGIAALQAGILGRLAELPLALRGNFLLDRWKRNRNLKGQ